MTTRKVDHLHGYDVQKLSKAAFHQQSQPFAAAKERTFC